MGVIRWVGVVLLSTSALGCLSASDLDGLESQMRDVQVQLLELKKESPRAEDLVRLEGALDDRLSSLVRSQTDLGADVDELTEQVERLQAKLDDTNFRLAQLAQQIAATNQELQAVRSEAEEARRQRPTPPPPRTAPASDSSDPQVVYDSAYNAYVAGNLDLAILGFRQYLDDHAETALADNATYWLGECYYRQGRFRQAVERYDEVLEQFEESDRAASARLKKAYALLELGNRDAGIEELRGVACGFGGTDEALLAGQRLQELGFDVEC
ncbi:MAG: tetratricopeptide repeat protein [Acidobacteriota bacterium]